jgi:hypothetical protein
MHSSSSAFGLWIGYKKNKISTDREREKDKLRPVGFIIGGVAEPYSVLLSYSTALFVSNKKHHTRYENNAAAL